MKFEKTFRTEHPETVGETDKRFDDSNYTEWLENKIVAMQEQVKKLNIDDVSCSGFGKLNKTDNSNDQCSLCKYKSENEEHPACTFCIQENKYNEYYS